MATVLTSSFCSRCRSCLACFTSSSWISMATSLSRRSLTGERRGPLIEKPAVTQHDFYKSWRATWRSTGFRTIPKPHWVLNLYPPNWKHRRAQGQKPHNKAADITAKSAHPIHPTNATHQISLKHPKQPMRRSPTPEHLALPINAKLDKPEKHVKHTSTPSILMEKQCKKKPSLWYNYISCQ